MHLKHFQETNHRFDLKGRLVPKDYEKQPKSELRFACHFGTLEVKQAGIMSNTGGITLDLVTRRLQPNRSSTIGSSESALLGLEPSELAEDGRTLPTSC